MITHEDHHDGSESAFYPRIILGIPGPWANRAEAEARFREGRYLLEEGHVRLRDSEESFEAEYRGADPRMKAAFQASACRVRPSLTPADYRALESHRGVVYVLSEPYGRSTAADTASRMLEVGRAAIEAGGLAIKSECSAIAHSASRWRELEVRLGAAGGPQATRSTTVEERAHAWNPLFDAFVRLPILGEAGELYSCGMHLLGCPDALVELRDFPGDDLRTGHQVLEGFLRSVRIETFSGNVALKPAFQASGSGDVFASILEPCTQYLPQELFWNRWGCFRLRRS